MRILQVVHSLPFYSQAGAEIYTLGLSLQLSKKHQVGIFCRISDPAQKEYAVEERNFGAIKAFLINNTFKYCGSFGMLYENEAIDAKFSQVLDKVNPDVVHIQHLAFLSTGIIRKIKEKGIPAVFTLHDYWLMCPRWHLFKKSGSPCAEAFTSKFGHECVDCLGEMFAMTNGILKLYGLSKRLFPPLVLNRVMGGYSFCAGKFLKKRGNGINKLVERNRKIRNLLEYVDIFLAPSEYLKKRFEDFGIPGKKIRLNRYGFDLSQFIVHDRTRQGKIRFAFIGTMLPAKGAHVLIEAFNSINKDSAELKIYGKLRPYSGFETYLPYLRRIAGGRHIEFMGEFMHEQIGHILKDIDVLIAPSLWQENSPLVIHEAFLAGVPVVASNIGGIPELISDSENGLLFNAGDASDLKEKISFLISNRDIIDKFRRNLPDVKGIEENCAENELVYGSLIAKDRDCGYPEALNEAKG